MADMRTELDWRQLFALAQMAATIHAAKITACTVEEEGNQVASRFKYSSHGVDEGNCSCVHEAFVLYHLVGKEMDKT